MPSGHVVEGSAASDDGHHLRSQLSQIKQLHLAGIQRDLQVLIEIGAALLLHDVIDAKIGEVHAEGLAGIGVTMYFTATISFAGIRKGFDRQPRIEWSRRVLIDEQIKDGLLAIPVGDAEGGVVIAAAAHVDEGQIIDAVLRRNSCELGHDRILDHTLVEERALRRSR